MSLHIRSVLLLAALGTLTGKTTVRADNECPSNDPRPGCHECFHQQSGTPSIDGRVLTDPGWEGAARISLSESLGATPTSKLQAGVKNNFLYLAWEIDGSAAPPEGNTTVVIGFSSNDGIGQHDWRINVTPFFVQPIAEDTPFTPTSIEYFHLKSEGHDGWNSEQAVSHAPGDTPWMSSAVKAIKNGERWSMEMKIPIITSSAIGDAENGFYFPPNPPQGALPKFYTNVIGTKTVQPESLVTQDTWPIGLVIAPGGPQDPPKPINQNTPPVRMWGNVTLNERDLCKGVTLEIDDIGIIDPKSPDQNPTTAPLVDKILTYIPEKDVPPGPPFPLTTQGCDQLATDYLWSEKKRSDPNQYVLRPKNSAGIDQSISATFLATAFGIPGSDEWKPIRVLNDHQPPGESDLVVSGTLAPGQKKGMAATFTLSYRQSCKAKYAANQWGCVRVHLDSNDPNTRIRTQNIHHNLKFVTASRYVGTAYARADEPAHLGPSLVPASTHKLMYLIVDQDEAYIASARQAAVANMRASREALFGRIDGNRELWTRQLRSPQLARMAASAFQPDTTAVATWIGRGYRDTGGRLQIRGQNYRAIEHTQDFGYVAGHSGDFKEWKLNNPTATGLKKIGENIYSYELIPGQVLAIQVVIEALGEAIRACCFHNMPTKGTPVAASGFVFLGFLAHRRRRRRD